jgi:sugar fermentation stimulation protein A
MFDETDHIKSPVQARQVADELSPASPLLQRACLLRRYQRFLADVRLADGQEVTLHCPNTGRMTGCAEPDWGVWFSVSDNPKRKYSRSWELSESDAGYFIGVNTARANALVAAAIQSGVIGELQGYGVLRQEVRYGEENSRIDLLLEQGTAADCYIEVKSVTLLGWDAHPELAAAGVGFFPDAPSARASKHLRELIRMKEAGVRAVILFCVQHTGIREVRPATHIDPSYSALLAEAHQAGVELLAYGADISPQAIHLVRPLPVHL